MPTFAPPSPDEIISESASFRPPAPDEIESFSPPSPDEIVTEQPAQSKLKEIDFSDPKFQKESREKFEAAEQMRWANEAFSGAESNSQFLRAVVNDPVGAIKSIPGSVLSILSAPGKLAYNAAVDLIAMDEDKKREELVRLADKGWDVDVPPKAEYGGNLASMMDGNEQTPAEKFIGESAKTNPKLAVAANLAKSLPELASMMAVNPTGTAGKLVALGFSADMIINAKPLFDSYAEEINKPEGDQDAGKLAELKSGIISTFVMAPLAGMHGIDGAVESVAASPTLEKFAPKTADALRTRLATGEAKRVLEEGEFAPFDLEKPTQEITPGEMPTEGVTLTPETLKALKKKMQGNQVAPKPAEERQRPKPIDRQERRDLESRAYDAINARDPIEREGLYKRLEKIQKDHQAVRNELADAKTTGDKLRAEIELTELENELRKLAGKEEIELARPITEEDQAKHRAWYEKRAVEIEGKIERGEPLDKKDRQDWRIAGRDEAELPAEETISGEAEAAKPTNKGAETLAKPTIYYREVTGRQAKKTGLLKELADNVDNESEVTVISKDGVDVGAYHQDSDGVLTTLEIKPEFQRSGIGKEVVQDLLETSGGKLKFFNPLPSGKALLESVGDVKIDEDGFGTVTKKNSEAVSKSAGTKLGDKTLSPADQEKANALARKAIAEGRPIDSRTAAEAGLTLPEGWTEKTTEDLPGVKITTWEPPATSEGSKPAGFVISGAQGYLAKPELRAKDQIYTRDVAQAAVFPDNTMARQASRAFASLGPWKTQEFTARKSQAKPSDTTINPAPIDSPLIVEPTAEQSKIPSGADLSKEEDARLMAEYNSTRTEDLDKLSDWAKAAFRMKRAKTAFKSAGKWNELDATGRKRWQAARSELEQSVAAFDVIRKSTPAETPKPAEPTTISPDIEKHLDIPVPDVSEARRRLQSIEELRQPYQQEYSKLSEERKLLANEIISSRGSRFSQPQIKKSAPKGKVARWHEIAKQMHQIDNNAQVLTESGRADRKAVESAKDAEIIADKSLPLVRRVDRLIRYLQDQKKPIPQELIDARNVETARILREKYPDITPEEITKMRQAVESEIFFGNDPAAKDAHKRVPELDLYGKRRAELEAEAKNLPSEFSEELGAKLNRFSAQRQSVGNPYDPVEEISVKDLADLKKEITAEVKRIHEENEAARIAEHEARIADHIKEGKMMEEAQQIADSAKKAGSPKEAQFVKTELIRRIKAEIDKLAASDNVKLSKNDEGSYAASGDSGTGAFGEIEKAGNKFKVTTWEVGADKKFSATVDSLEEAESLIKGMAASGRGNVVIGVPGDGVFRLRNHGPALMLTLDGARKLSVSTSTKGYTTSGGPEKPPGAIKTVQDWNDAKDFHGLEPTDTIHDWSNALLEVAKKVDPENPKSVTTKMVDDWIDAKASKGEKPKSKESSATESRIETGRGKKQNVFDMDEGDLADLLEERFGDTSPGASKGSFGRGGDYNFPSYDAFRDWMDARYGERDLEGMKLAFAEAERDSKVRYIKENKASAAHKKDWISHMATGSDLPKADPPIPRTTPRPTPSGRPAPAPAPGGSGRGRGSSGSGARPGQPPPPPRQPTNHRKFDITALTQLFRRFSKSPRVNERLMKAYGRFVHGTKAVELKARLMWDTKLAERVLGHEIGHFIDLVIAEMGDGKQLGERIAPLWDAMRKQVYTKTELKNEARALSRQWRGNFPNGHYYRDTAVELFADFMSAMFNKPDWVNQNYPKLFDKFQDLREGKPQFADAYREIETWLQGGTMIDELRVQDKAAVERTLDELLKTKEPSKASFLDRVKFGTVSLWGRAFEKEGKPRELGKSIADELEYVKTWAAKENALWVDDFAKRVTPELEKVSDDPIQARADLLSYTKAVRTIGERRAAGVWIEQNPAEARAMLEHLLDSEPGLRAKFASDLASAADADLYDLSAAIFREVHDGGERYADKIAGAIDDLNLGIKGQDALMAFNVRGKLLNPGGLTVENAEKMIEQLKDKLGDTKFTALETAAKNLRDLLFDVQEKMYDEGLISKKTWRELIEPNRDNYVPYAVLDYFDGNVRAGVMKQKGTAKDVADIAAATQLKLASSNSWRQKQRQVQLLRDAYNAGGVRIPVTQKLRRARDIEEIRAKHQNDDISRAVYYLDGEPHLIEFPADKGKLLEAAMANPAFYEHISWIADASDMTHKVMQFYTQFSVPFLLWRNPIRGARTAGLKVGFGKVAKQMTRAELASNYRLAENYANAAFGGEMLPEVRELVDRQILLPPRLSQAMVRDSASLRDLLANHTILANQIRGLHSDAKPAWWKGGEVGHKGVILSEKVFTGYEAFEKIYNYKAALEAGMSKEQAGAIARRAGIPKPGVGGKWSLAMEVWFPWTRVHIQGVRASYDMLRDPNTTKAFAARFLLTEAMPRVAKVAIGTGVVSGAINWALSDGEDKDDGVMAEFFRRVSPYKMALDDTVPLYFYDPRTGKTHYLWEYKSGQSVPKHFEAVSLRLPASEEGRLFGTLLYNSMISAPGAADKLGKPGETFVTHMGNWTKNYAAPGVSPILETGSDLYDMIALGKNPKDAYRNQPAANEQLFDAGGMDRAQAIAGYVLNQAGSAGELAGVMAANFGLLDERALSALSTRLPGDYREWNQKIPFLKSAIAHDNYAQFREEQIPKLEEERIRSKARLLMSTETRGLYDFYYRNLKRQDKLTDVEKEQFEASKYFVKEIWGNLPNSDSFYAKAAHAVGKDGSREAKETLKRDLDSAAAGAISKFKEYRAKP